MDAAESEKVAVPVEGGLKGRYRTLRERIEKFGEVIDKIGTRGEEESEPNNHLALAMVEFVDKAHEHAEKTREARRAQLDDARQAIEAVFVGIRVNEKQLADRARDLVKVFRSAGEIMVEGVLDVVDIADQAQAEIRQGYYTEVAARVARVEGSLLQRIVNREYFRLHPDRAQNANLDRTRASDGVNALDGMSDFHRRCHSMADELFNNSLDLQAHALSIRDAVGGRHERRQQPVNKIVGS